MEHKTSFLNLVLFREFWIIFKLKKERVNGRFTLIHNEKLKTRVQLSLYFVFVEQTETVVMGHIFMSFDCEHRKYIHNFCDTAS